MITWADDVNLDRICIDINKYISSYKMKNYFIYGLQQQERPHVRLAPKSSPVLDHLFKKSNYIIETTDVVRRYCGGCDDHHIPGRCCCVDGCELCDKDTISIGLRRDIRSNIIVSRKLIKTIVFALEDKLEVPEDAKLKLGRRVRKKLILPRKELIKPEIEEVNPSLVLNTEDINPPSSRTTLMQRIQSVITAAQAIR